jgi:aminoglycoside 6'-N-acetyltransferase I
MEGQNFRLVNLADTGEAGRQQAAEILVLAFRQDWPDSWTDIESASKEVDECLDPERICRAAVDPDGRVLGWIGGISGYEGNVWELHPLVVHPQFHGRGLGRTLVLELEDLVRARGGITVFLGTDDVTNMTSVGGIDLYPNVLEKAAQLHNRRRHPFTFYQKLGYEVVGLVPDANGPGKPDIYMAKRVAKNVNFSE